MQTVFFSKTFWKQTKNCSSIFEGPIKIFRSGCFFLRDGRKPKAQKFYCTCDVTLSGGLFNQLLKLFRVRIIVLLKQFVVRVQNARNQRIVKNTHSCTLFRRLRYHKFQLTYGHNRCLLRPCYVMWAIFARTSHECDEMWSLCLFGQAGWLG